MAKLPTYALLLALCLLLNVKYFTLATNTTQHEFNSTSNSTVATLGQSTTAVTQHQESSTASARVAKPDNSDTNETSNAVNTTLTTMSQGSEGSLTTAPSTNNGTDTMASNVTKPPPGGGTTRASQQTTLRTTSTKAPGTTKSSKPESLRNGIIILVVVIGVIVVIFLFCYFQRRKKGRNSFNLHSGASENAGIPLSPSVAEKNAALNMKEDKIDMHPIQPPESTPGMEDSPKHAAASDPADGHEGESNSTASTVPKDDEPDKLSLDSSQASLLPSATGNQKDQDHGENGNATPPTETQTEALNENNNNSSQWAILQLKRGGRMEEPYPPTSTVIAGNHGEGLSQMERATLMQADFEEDQGRCAEDLAQMSPFYDMLINLEP